MKLDPIDNATVYFGIKKDRHGHFIPTLAIANAEGIAVEVAVSILPFKHKDRAEELLLLTHKTLSAFTIPQEGTEY